MKLMNNVSKEEKKLIRKMFWRSGAMYASVNPVTMGGGGFLLFHDSVYQSFL